MVVRLERRGSGSCVSWVLVESGGNPGEEVLVLSYRAGVFTPGEEGQIIRALEFVEARANTERAWWRRALRKAKAWVFSATS